MKWPLLALLAPLALGACYNQRVLAQSDRSIVLYGVTTTSEERAMKTADEHCKQGGRHARLIQSDGLQRSYTCER